MIHIKIAQPRKLKASTLSPMSAFVQFAYDAKIVEQVRALGTRIYIPEEKCWEIPVTSVSSLCNKLTDYEIEITGQLVKEAELSTQLPADFAFKTKPFNHQIEGVLYGFNHDCFLLGDDQGLGKTKQIIDLAVLLKRTKGLKHCFIICGVNGNKYNWEEEVAKHSDEKSWILGTRYTKRPPIKAREGSAKDKLDDLNNLPNCLFIITNIETLRAMSYTEKVGKGNKTIRRYPIAEKIIELCSKGEIGMIPFDEAHKAKNPDSQQGEALMSINSQYKIPMSGTFLMNNPLDLYMPLRWAGFESHSFYDYKRHYCIFGGFNNKDVVGYKNLNELQELLARVMLRRTKTEVLDLPEKVHVTEYIEMSADQERIYEEVKKAIRQEIDKIKISPDPLAQMIRLRQATAYPGILSTTVTESSKMDRMVDMVEDIVASGQKVVIFSQWEKVTAIALNKLYKYKPAYITGDVKSEDRMAEVNRFQNDDKCQVIIGTVGAMGTGLTLNAASNVIFLDEPWNRALKDQAEDRAHRIGTKGTVRVVTLVCKDTIDERIMELVEKKGRMSDLIIDSKSVNVGRQDIDFLLS